MFEAFSYASTTAITSGALALSLGAVAAFRLSQAGATSALSYYETEQAIDTINLMGELENGWAGEGSLAPTDSILDQAKYIARRIFPAAPFAEIAPMPNGTIAFDWETDEGVANLEIGENNFSFYLELTETDQFYPLSGMVQNIPEAIGSFISSALRPNYSGNRPEAETSFTRPWLGAAPEYA